MKKNDETGFANGPVLFEVQNSLITNYPKVFLPKKFIHYTSLSSFMKMIEEYAKELQEDYFNKNNKNYLKKEKSITMFASQIQFLNDKKEYDEGVDSLKKYLSEKAKTEENLSLLDTYGYKQPSDYHPTPKSSLFATCFCDKRDDLSQWRAYGSGVGIAIEFDYLDDNKEGKIKHIVTSASGNNRIDNLTYFIRPLKLDYDTKNDHTDLFEKSFEIIFKSTDIRNPSANKLDLMCELAVPLCKNESFIDESESRLLILPTDYSKIEYRETRGRIVPFISFKMLYCDNNEALTKIPIKEIMISPCEHQNLILSAIYQMLEPNEEKNDIFDYDLLKTDEDGNKYIVTTSDIKISLSKIPFRN